MNAQTEARLIDHLYECVNVHPYKDELLNLMQDQVNDLNSDKYWMLQEDGQLLSSCAQTQQQQVKKTKRLTLECPVACHQLAKVSAAAMGITIQEMVYHVVCRYLAEKADQEPQMMAIRESVLGSAEIDELPSDICTYAQREELVNATTHKLPWE